MGELVIGAECKVQSAEMLRVERCFGGLGTLSSALGTAPEAARNG